MKSLALATILLLTACHRAGTTDCATFNTSAPYNAPDLTPSERDGLEVSGLRAAYAAGWACGYREGHRD